MERLLEETAGPLAGQEQRARVRVRDAAGGRSTGCAWTCPITRRTRRSSATRATTAGRGPFPQIRVVGLGECGTRAVLGAATVAAGHRGAAAGPPAAGQARTRGPAAGRPQLPVPRPARGGARRRGARAVAGEERRGPAGAGGAARRDLAVTDRRPGRLPPDAPQGRRPARTSPASRSASSSTP